MSGFIDGMLICLGISLGLIIDNQIKKSYDIPITYKQAYSKGYRDAKQIYESHDFDYTEEKLLKD